MAKAFQTNVNKCIVTGDGTDITGLVSVIY